MEVVRVYSTLKWPEDPPYELGVYLIEDAKTRGGRVEERLQASWWISRTA